MWLWVSDTDFFVFRFYRWGWLKKFFLVSLTHFFILDAWGEISIEILVLFMGGGGGHRRTVHSSLCLIRKMAMTDVDWSLHPRQHVLYKVTTTLPRPPWAGPTVGGCSCSAPAPASTGWCTGPRCGSCPRTPSAGCPGSPPCVSSPILTVK